METEMWVADQALQIARPRGPLPVPALQPVPGQQINLAVQVIALLPETIWRGVIVLMHVRLMAAIMFILTETEMFIKETEITMFSNAITDQAPGTIHQIIPQ